MFPAVVFCGASRSTCAYLPCGDPLDKHSHADLKLGHRAPKT